jgi:solute carrier family 36 (proton-coupled amino acid transporter)
LEEIEEEDEDRERDEEDVYTGASGYVPGLASGSSHHVEPHPPPVSVRIDSGAFPSERSPLLNSRGKSRSASRRRRLSSAGHGEHGDATVGQAILMVRFCFLSSLALNSSAYDSHSY